MRKILLSIFIIHFSFFTFHSASAQQFSSKIKTSAMEMSRALISKKSSVFLQFMHPSMVKLAGGKVQLTAITDSALTVFEQFGGKISKINYGNPSEVVEYKKTMQSVLPQSTFLTSPLGNVELSSSLIAISTDKGANWTFIDTNLFGIDKIKSVMPDISPLLVIPKAAPPKFLMKE
jgi:hypothetical protein